MKSLATLFLLFGTCTLSAQTAPLGPIGEWEGESVCQVPKPCTTEHVIYEIKQSDAGKITIKADKLVEGKREWMGDLSCQWSDKEQKLSCPAEGRQPGEWVFLLKSDRLVGVLTLSEGNVIYRKIAVTRRK